MRNIHTDQPQHEDDIYTGDLKEIPEIRKNARYFTEIWQLNKPDFFKLFAQLFVRLANEGKINRQTAAYKIADLMSVDELTAIPEIEEIILFAGELELPYHQATPNGDKASYDKQWTTFQKMIHRLPVAATFFCTNCDNPFLFTIEEQEHYASHKVVYVPERCPACRELHKKQVDHTNISCEVCGFEEDVDPCSQPPAKD